MKLIYAILAGMLLPLAFAPFGIYTLAIVSLAILLATWVNATPKQAFIRGLAFGIGFFGVGVSWIFVSIHTFGNAPIPIAILVTLLFILILSLYPALQGLLLTRLLPHNTIAKYTLAFPASYTLFEWLRGFLLSGFPWLQIGESQVGAPLQSWAPIIGVYGLTFIVAFSSGVLVACFNKQMRQRLFYAIIIAVALWTSALALSRIGWTERQAEPIQITMIQGDIDQFEKWRPDTIATLLKLYPDLTREHWDSEVIIWPEAAITVAQIEIQQLLDDLSKEAASQNSTIILGIPIISKTELYNGIIAIGKGQGSYHKRMLVPFGEYTPMLSITRYLMRWIDIPMSSFNHGSDNQSNIKTDGIIITPFICYEIAYSSEVRKMLRDGNMIIVVTDDSWFGRSLAPAQHLQIAQMRALETGRYVLTATNNGITAFITPKGELQAVAPAFQREILTSKAYGMFGSTPWVKMGNTPVISALILLFLLAWRMQLLVKLQQKRD